VDGVGEAAATPSDVFVLLLCPRCCGVVSDDDGSRRICSGPAATTYGFGGADVRLKMATLKHELFERAFPA
jgi:hypothetical protein